MLVRCVSVWEVAESKYSSHQLFLPVVLLAVPDEEGGLTWEIERLTGELFDTRRAALGFAFAFACRGGLLWRPAARPSSTVDEFVLSVCLGKSTAPTVQPDDAGDGLPAGELDEA